MVSLGPTTRWWLEAGDSRQLLEKVATGSVQMICTDPPYNLAPHSTGNIKLDWRSDLNNDVADWDLEPFNPSEWRDEFLRVLSPTGNLFAFTSYNLLGKWHEAFDPVFDTFQFMVWHKTNPTPKFRRAGFLNSCELIVCMWNKGHTWNFTTQKEMHNFIESPICMGRERVREPKHPAQKPLRVMKRLLELGTKTGDVVLDPFAGVGSTGVAALQMGRRFIGFERENDYAQAAIKRLDAASAGE